MVSRNGPGQSVVRWLVRSAVSCTLAGSLFMPWGPAQASPQAPGPEPQDEATPPAAVRPTATQIEQARRIFRRSRDDAAARADAARVLYPLIKVGSTWQETRHLLGSPDRFPPRESHARFLNYLIGEQQRIEIEFDRARERVVRKRETGLEIDPKPSPAGPIPDAMRPYLADYRVSSNEASQRTVLRAGFLPAKARLVWGEPMLLTLSVANIGTADFEFMFGGDSRGKGRHDRITVMVTDEQGQPLVDPHADAPNLGGISSFELITPGGLEFTHAVDLTKFRTMEGPGRYNVTCSFAFDEPHAEANRPAKPVVRSSFPLTILPRTPARVSRVLDELQAEAENSSEPQLSAAMVEIARFGREDGLPRLEAYINTGKLPQRLAALAALPVSGPTALDIALAGLDDADPVIRSAASTALGQIPHARATAALLEAETREAPTVRAAILIALGTSKSPRARPALARALDEDASEIRSAAIEALLQYGGDDAVSMLRNHVTSSDLAFRFQVVHALTAKLRHPLNPEWLLPILMCRRHNHPAWHGSLGLVRMRGGERAVPLLLSCLDFEVPWSYRNFWILHSVEYSRGAPKFDYAYDPNSAGTPAQHEQNRQALAKLRKFAEPPGKHRMWPAPPVPELITDPPIDFTVSLSTRKGEGETPATVTCGFFRKTWNRNGGSVSFQPTAPYLQMYQVAADVRAILATDAAAAASKLTDQQLQALRELDLPARYPVVEEGLSLLYIWWQESPDGPLRRQARERLSERVRAAVQQFHTDHVAFAAAANQIINGAASAGR